MVLRNLLVLVPTLVFPGGVLIGLVLLGTRTGRVLAIFAEIRDRLCIFLTSAGFLFSAPATATNHFHYFHLPLSW